MPYSRCLPPILLLPILFLLLPQLPLAAGEGASEQQTQEVDASRLKQLSSRWYVLPGERPVYYLRDGGRYLDLFSYHMSDSNHDGTDEVRVSHDERYLIIDSQGYPNHPTAIFPNSSNPNSIKTQHFRFRLPLEPKLADQITRLPMGPIGVALNGVVFFNPFEFGGMNAVEGYSEVWLDSCCGHPQQDGVYHYHKYPSCVKSPFKDDGKQHSPVIGFAFDGFPVYGPYESDRQLAMDLRGEQALDVCNGHTDTERGYHYHVTPGRFPYILGGYAGVVERSNNRHVDPRRTGAIEDNSSGKSSLGSAIRTLTPGTLVAGKKQTVVIHLNTSSRSRGGIPANEPSWVQVGPFEAKKIERRGASVVVELDIPDDAALGVLFDCHLEFETSGGRRPLVFKKNEVLRVIADSAEK